MPDHEQHPEERSSTPPSSQPPSAPSVPPGQRAVDDGREYRPLPSVNMPLLREERRATRAKHVAIVTALAVGALGGLVAAVLQRGVPDFGWGGSDAKGSGNGKTSTASTAAGVELDAGPRDAGVAEAEARADAGDASVVDAGAPVADEAVTRTVHHFGDAGSFRRALEAAGIGATQRANLEKALEPVLDFRRCRTEDRIIVERNEEGELVRFEYHQRPTEFIRVTRNEAGALRAERVQVEIERKRLARGGIVTSSLGNALVREGLGRTLVRDFLGVFGSRVNFSKDTRSGDVFRILVDKEYIDGEFHGYGRVHALEYEGSRTGTLRAYWFETGSGPGDYYDENGRTLRGWLRPPCRYDRISSPFDPNRMHPTLGRVVPHMGVDYAAGRGTKVWAAAPGTVTFAGHKGANGNLVSIRHEDGYRTHYAHLQRIARGIEPGTKVEKREVIGYIGSTGRSTGPHLHFALKRRGQYVNPMKKLNGPGRRLPPGKLARFKEHMRKLHAELSEVEIDAEGPPPEPPLHADGGTSAPVLAPE